MLIKILDRKSLGEDTPFDELKKLGDVEIYDSTSAIELPDKISNADIIVINKIKITSDVLSKAKKLKLICVFATGYDNVDLNAVKERNVALCNVPGYSTDSVALFTVSTALSLFTHLREYNEFVRDGSYTRSGIPNRLTPVFRELKGKTWGIIGYGNIGRAVGEVAKAFGANLIVNSRHQRDDAPYADVETICREADIITLHCPLNDDSRGLISTEKINLMKKDVVIVNSARGAVVVEDDIAKAVKCGRIGAFGSDVYSTEPFGEEHPFYEIKDYPNVLFTPHAAWGSYDSRVRCINVICQNIKAFLKGETLNRIDK